MKINKKSTIALLALALSTTSLKANAFSPLLYFVQTDSYSSPYTTPPGSSTISGGFTGPNGSAITNSFNPGAAGLNPADYEFGKTIVSGNITYAGVDNTSAVVANLLAFGSVVQSVTLASGPIVINNAPFSADFSKSVYDNFNKDLSIQFVGTNLAQLASTSSLPYQYPSHTVTVYSTPVPFELSPEQGFILGVPLFLGLRYLKKKRAKSSSV